MNLLIQCALPRITIGDGQLVSDRGVVTAPEADRDFIRHFVDAMEQHRHWDREMEMVPA